MGVRSVGQEDPLEWEMATHSNILTWIIPWTEKPDGLQPIGSQKSQTGFKQQHGKVWGRGHGCTTLPAASRVQL